MMNNTLSLIINDYKEKRIQYPDTWIAHCASLEVIDDVIFNAALSLDHLGRKNGHQRRLRRIDLEKFAINIIDKKEELYTLKKFSDLLVYIEGCKVKGIGELACYDTAYRIGAKLKIHPDKIYLHAGTRIGAERLLNKKIREKSISRDLLPFPFQDENLTNAEIEDILCIYKDSFSEIRLPMKGCFKPKSKCYKSIP